MEHEITVSRAIPSGASALVEPAHAEIGRGLEVPAHVALQLQRAEQGSATVRVPCVRVQAHEPDTVAFDDADGVVLIVGPEVAFFRDVEGCRIGEVADEVELPGVGPDDEDLPARRSPQVAELRTKARSPTRVHRD